jgi:tetratricopeptide (TPR) repeat protein
MTVSIAEVLHEAQEALNGGDFRAASQTCGQLVRQFPGYARAHGLLGEAYREQGQLAGARAAFAEALARNQRAPGTYLGLGLIAEDEGSPEHALAYCQVAWELAPDQRHLRDPLARVAMRRYGSDGDLQLSHAALAQLHARASRYRRAVDEYRRALATLPERVDLKLGMAECLWNMGHTSEAGQLAHEVLEQLPESAAALVIAADIEWRSGNTTLANELLGTLRTVDPDGDIVAGMLGSNPRADRAFLEVPVDAIPSLDDTIVTAPVERPRIAPAPDFEYRPTRTELPAASMEELEPISMEEFGGDAASVQSGADSSDAFNFDSLGIEGDLTPISIEELGGLPEGVQPAEQEALDAFDGTSIDLPPLDTTGIEAGLQELMEAEPADTSVEPEPSFQLPTEDEPVPEDFDAVSYGFEDFSGLDAVDEVVSTSPAPDNLDTDMLAGWESQQAQDEPVDDLAALAAALEDDVAEALSRAGEDVIQQDIDTSRPPATPPSGYTTMLQSLGDAGLAPFDPRARGTASPDEAMPTFEMDDQLLEQSRPSAQTDDQLTADWDMIDDEILRAMPEGYQPGYTEELQSLDDSGLSPFEIDEDDDSGLSSISPFNPFAAEPSAPVPFPGPSSLADSDETQTESLESHIEAGQDDELMGGLEPFAFEEFDSAGAPGAGGHNQAPWESGTSAIPSDEDLDALLAFEDVPVEETARLPEREDVESRPEPNLTDQDAPGAVDHASGLSASEADLLRMDPDLAELEQSIAVTRDLSADASAEQQQDLHAEATAAHDEPAGAGESRQPSTSELAAALRPTTEVFHRARQVKEELVSEGIIAGNRELVEGIATDDLRRAEDSIPTRVLDPGDLEQASRQVDEDDIGRSLEFDAARDVSTLRAELELTPDDDEMRWWLAEALREQGELTDAFAEYRWLIRNAPARHDEVLQALNECVERDQAPELAHRLLGDLYRRHGDVSRASAHAALALQQRKRTSRSR